jgi:hypothetical protein
MGCNSSVQQAMMICIMGMDSILCMLHAQQLINIMGWPLFPSALMDDSQPLAHMLILHWNELVESSPQFLAPVTQP